MKYFTVFALAFLIIYAMQVDASKGGKGKGKDKGKDKPKGKSKEPKPEANKHKEDEAKDDKSEQDKAKDEDDEDHHDKKTGRDHSGECKEDCPDELSSVCAYNGSCHKLFDDECKMEAENCKHGETFNKVDIDECSNDDNTKCEDDD